MNKNIFKSFGAVMAGIIAIFVLSTIMDILMESVGIFPPRGKEMPAGLLVIALVYRCAIAVAGGYITAAVAPGEPERHAIILGLIGIVLSTIGAIMAWDMLAHWYPIALIITALPCCWYGGRLRTGKAKLFNKTQNI
jgi:hypothetical protein